MQIVHLVLGTVTFAVTARFLYRLDWQRRRRVAQYKKAQRAR